MRLDLQREPSRDAATLGALYVDGAWLCWTLEDEMREVAGRPVDDWKIAGKTAIPLGTYPVLVTMSMRFGRRLPLVESVPGFTGIRIHPGNTEADTEGCILLGLDRGNATVRLSRLAVHLLISKLGAQTALLTIHPPWGIV